MGNRSRTRRIPPTTSAITRGCLILPRKMDRKRESAMMMICEIYKQSVFSLVTALHGSRLTVWMMNSIRGLLSGSAGLQSEVGTGILTCQNPLRSDRARARRSPLRCSQSCSSRPYWPTSVASK